MLKLKCIHRLRVAGHQTEIDAACVWTLEQDRVGIGNRGSFFLSHTAYHGKPNRPARDDARIPLRVAFDMRGMASGWADRCCRWEQHGFVLSLH
jgi:hypothetical protein